MYAPEFRWRAVVLHYAYGVPCVRVGQIFGISSRTVLRWYQQFKRCGHVMPGKRLKKTRQPPHVQRFVADYVKVHTCFYVEELQAALRQRFGADTSGFSACALLRLLNFDLGLSRKVLERRAREVVPHEIEDFVAKVKCWYKYPEQLVFVDETSKNGLNSMRRYAWAARAVVRVPFARGKRGGRVGLAERSEEAKQLGE
ncbi:Transposase [Phytophthora megakarya]|uniref:Transposase n=1 Tax=Phytophthora megakarya TaxID=4795 RepID=A0A225VHG5_9STRA|nr:Transposase [Phytophthora megakarya]